VPAARAALLDHFAAEFGPCRFSHRRWGRRLDSALARLDRYADFGRGREGSGLELARSIIEACAEECRWNRGAPRPKSLAYFVPLLEEASKKWRRDQARRLDTPPPGWRPEWASPKAKKKGRRAAGGDAPAE
jgi:hypothetical protein